MYWAAATTDGNSYTEASENLPQAEKFPIQTEATHGILEMLSWEDDLLTTARENALALSEQTKSDLAEIGEIMLDLGIMPERPYLDAVGLDEPTALGYLAIRHMSPEGDPEARKPMEAYPALEALYDFGVRIEVIE